MRDFRNFVRSRTIEHTELREVSQGELVWQRGGSDPCVPPRVAYSSVAVTFTTRPDYRNQYSIYRF